MRLACFMLQRSDAPFVAVPLPRAEAEALDDLPVVALPLAEMQAAPRQALQDLRRAVSAGVTMRLPTGGQVELRVDQAPVVAQRRQDAVVEREFQSGGIRRGGFPLLHSTTDARRARSIGRGGPGGYHAADECGDG